DRGPGRSALAVSAPRLPAPHAGQRETGQPFLARLEGLFLTLREPQRCRGVGEDLPVEQGRDIDTVRLPGWRPAALAVRPRLIEFHTRVRATAVETRILEYEPRPGAVPEEVPHLALRGGVEFGEGGRRVGDARCAKVVAMRRDERHRSIS